jgi:MarR family transcriptional regulator, organic hydroperoxide resistance regulator
MRFPAGDRAHPLDLEGLDPCSARVFGAFMQTTRLHRQLMLHVFAEQETPPGQAMCLRIVAAHDGATQREIGEMLHLSAPTVTSMLKRMERHGTIVRETDPDDQRVTRVRLTPAGRTLDAELRVILTGRLGQVLDSMSENDRRELARLLDELAGRLEVGLGEEAPATVGGPAR